MANYYSSAFLRRLTKQKGRPWCGVLQYQVPNPNYVPDSRDESQRPEYLGRGKSRKPNPNYVPDTRKRDEKKPTIQRQVSKTFDPATVSTKTDANKALTEWHAQMEAEHAAPGANLTVMAYVKQYISMREKAGMEPSTVRDYTKTCHYFGKGGAHAIEAIPLRDLTPRQVEDWEAELLGSGLSGTTVLKAHRLLKQVCKSAVEKDELQKTPVRGFKAPSRSTGKPNALDAEGHTRAMLALSSMKQTPVVVAAQLALYLGLRRGEICALTWGNVDLQGTPWPNTPRAQWDTKKVRVNQSFGEALGRGAYLKKPKTSAGARVLALEGGIVDVLAQRRAAMWDEWSAAMKQANIIPTEETFSTLYVIGDTKGSPCVPDTLTRSWRAIARKHNLVGTEGRCVTFHDLRHSAATAAITRGADVSSVAANLGHQQVSTTLNMYTSRDVEAQRQASRLVAEALDAARMGKVLPFHQNTTSKDENETAQAI